MEIKILKHKKSFKKRNFQPNSDFYWKIVLSIIFFLIFTSFIFGGYLFMQINKDFDFLGLEAGGRTQTIEKTRIDKVLEYFSQKKNKSTDILSSPLPISDPSL